MTITAYLWGIHVHVRIHDDHNRGGHNRDGHNRGVLIRTRGCIHAHILLFKKINI